MLIRKRSEVPTTSSDAPEIVGKTIGLAIDAGAVGCNLEDSFPANGKLREKVDQTVAFDTNFLGVWVKV